MSRSTNFDFGANIGWQDADNLAPWGSGTEAGGNARQGQSRSVNQTHHSDSADPASVYKDDPLLIDAVVKTIKARLNQLREEIHNMLPAGEVTGTKRTDGIPTLNNEALSTTAKPVRILAIKSVEGRFGKQIKAKIALEGQMFFWYLSLKSPQWQTLKSKFGLDENNYVNAEILLGLERDEFEEKYYPTVSFPNSKKK